MPVLHVQGSIVLFLFFGVSLLLLLIQYRTLIRGKNRGSRSVLFLCRTVVIIILLFLLVDPYLQWRSRKQRDPEIAIFTDFSSSMQSDSLSENTDISKILNRLDRTIKKQNGVPNYYGFGKIIRPISIDGPLILSDERTEFTHLPDKMKSVGADYNFILSDGIATTGMAPGSLSFEGCGPVNILVFGEQEKGTDISIQSVRHPQSIIKGDSLNLEVSLSYSLDQTTSTKIEIRDSNGRTIAHKMIEQGIGEGFNKISFSVPSDDLTDNLSVDIIPSVTEKKLTNNHFPFHVDIQSKNEHLILLSGSLSFNSGFLKNRMAALPRVIIDHYFRTDGFSWNSPPEKGISNAPSIIVLDDFPESLSDRTLFNKIIKYCTDENIPLFYFEGPASDMHSGNLLANQFQLEFKRRTSSTKLALQASSNGLSFIDLSGVDKIPPQRRNITWTSTTGNLLEYSDGKSAVIQKQSGFTFTGFFMPDLAASSLKSSMTLKENSLSALVEKLLLLELLSDNSVAGISTENQAYDFGDRVIVEIRVNNLLQTTPALVQVKLENTDTGQSDLLPAKYDETKGFFSTIAVPKTAGHWTASSLISWNNGERSTTDSTHFSVRNIKVENRVTAPNYIGLEHIAESTKGAIYRINALDSMLNSVKITPVQSDYNFQISAISFQKFWAALILLLGIEWWIRKRNGLL